jgi:hypothetical protein
MEEKGLKEGMKRFKDALKLRDQDDPIFQYGELPCNVAGKGNFTRWNSPLSAFSGCDGDEPVFVDKIVRLCSSFDGQLSFAVELEALHEAFDFEELHRHFLYCQHLAELCARPEVLMGSETDMVYRAMIWHKEMTSTEWASLSDKEFAERVFEPNKKLLHWPSRLYSSTMFNSLSKELKQNATAKARTLREYVLSSPRWIPDECFPMREMALGESFINPVPIFAAWKIKPLKDNNCVPFIVGLVTGAVWT